MTALDHMLERLKKTLAPTGASTHDPRQKFEGMSGTSLSREKPTWRRLRCDETLSQRRRAFHINALCATAAILPAALEDGAACVRHHAVAMLAALDETAPVTPRSTRSHGPKSWDYLGGYCSCGLRNPYNIKDIILLPVQYRTRPDDKL